MKMLKGIAIVIMVVFALLGMQYCFIFFHPAEKPVEVERSKFEEQQPAPTGEQKSAEAWAAWVKAGKAKEKAEQLEKEEKFEEAVVAIDEEIAAYRQWEKYEEWAYFKNFEMCRALERRANLQTRLSQHDAAAQSWDEHLILCLSDKKVAFLLQHARYQRACCLQSAKQWHEAITAFEELVPADWGGDKDFEPHLRLAEIYEQAKLPIRDPLSAAYHRWQDKKKKEQAEEYWRRLQNRP